MYFLHILELNPTIIPCPIPDISTMYYRLYYRPDSSRSGKTQSPRDRHRVPGFSIGTNQLHSIDFSLTHSSCSVYTSNSLIQIEITKNAFGQTHRRRSRAANNPHTSSNSTNITPHFHHNTAGARRRILRNPSTSHAHALPRKNTLDRSSHQIP